MVTNPNDLPGSEAVLYIQGEGLHKSIMYLNCGIRAIVWMSFQELFNYYDSKCFMVEVHGRLGINLDHIRHLQLNVPFHVGVVRLTDNTTVPVNGHGCAKILHFLNLKHP